MLDSIYTHEIKNSSIGEVTSFFFALTLRSSDDMDISAIVQYQSLCLFD
jgi:hypothetical protein